MVYGSILPIMKQEMRGSMTELDRSKIEEAFGETIAGRGHDYYRRGHVIRVMKIRDKIHAEVCGRAPEVYSVNADLKDLKSSCSCPYSGMCKHGAAALYYFVNDGEVTDGDAIIEDLRKKSKEELVKLLENLILSNPSLISEVTFQKGGSKDIKHLVDDFGWRVSSNFTNYAAQQQDIHRLEKAVTRYILSLPSGEEKAGLVIQFLEEVKEYFNDVDDSDAALGFVIMECIESLAEELDLLSEEKKSDIVKRLEKLEEEDDYGYFDNLTDALGEAGEDD